MKYACIKQYDETDCGAAVLATICKHYGRRTTISRLREAAGTDNIGTNLTGIVKAASELGLNASAVKGDVEALFEDIPLPTIAHIVTDKGLLHYVVIHKITPEYIIIADPAVGIVKKSIKDFCAVWTGILVIITATDRFKEGSDTQSITQQFFSIIKPHWRLFLGIFLFSAIYMCLGFVGTYYFQIIIDNIVPSGNAELLHTISFCVITAYIFLVLAVATRGHLLLHLSKKLDMSLLYGFYSHVLKLPMNFFDTRKNGEIISRFNDAVHMRNAISNAAVSMVMDTVMAIVGGILLFTQDRYMFCISLIIVAIYTLLVFLFNRPYEKQNRNSMENSAFLTSYIVESLNGVQTIKSHGYEEKAKSTVKDRLSNLLQSSFKLGVMSNKQEAFKRAAELIGTTAVIWLGAYRVMSGNISLGELIAFYALLAYFLNPIKNLIDLQPQIQTAVVAAERLGDIMELDGENYAPATLKHLQGDIEFKHVSFRYGTRNPVLKDVSFTIKHGQRVAFVGESGAGKSTIAKLITALYRCENGEISINNMPIEQIGITTLREKTAYISQDAFLFTDTIYNNIAFDCANATPDTVVHCAELAGAHEFIAAMPLGYNTPVEENGANLSGGQRQRIAIARAFCREPDIMIFDEATSNLDSIADEAIERAIFDRQGTSIIIAHKLNLVKRCDCIFVMENDCIVESGTHDELMRLGGLYSRMSRSQ